MSEFIEKLAVVAGIALPFFNIPLIIRLWQRKSSEDLSITWALGVWVCAVLMVPQALRSTDIAFRSFGVVNIAFFSVVTALILKYRKKNSSHRGS